MSKIIGLIMHNPSMVMSASTVVLAVATFCQVIFRDPYTRLLIKKETSKFNEVSYNFLNNAIVFMDPGLKVEEDVTQRDLLSNYIKEVANSSPMLSRRARINCKKYISVVPPIKTDPPSSQ